MDIYQRATALRSLDDKSLPREMESFADSEEHPEPQGPTRVPGGHAENWSLVMSDIATNKRRRLKKGNSERSMEIGGSNGADLGGGDSNLISISRKFYSTNGILTPAAANQQTRAAPDGKVKYKASVSAGSNTESGELISVKRGQSAAQLKGYKGIPRPSKEEPKTIVLRKGLSSSQIKEFRSRTVGSGETDTMGVVVAPRGMSAADIRVPGRKKSLGNTQGGKVVEKVIIRRRKNDSRKSESEVRTASSDAPDSTAVSASNADNSTVRSTWNQPGGALDTVQERGIHSGEIQQPEKFDVEGPGESGGEDEVAVIQLSRSRKL